MAYRVDLTKTPKQILVDRINYVFGVSYTTDNIDFNDKGVQPLTKDEARRYGLESKVAADFKNGVAGNQEFILTRVDLATFLADEPVTVPKGEVTSSQELADYIVAQTGIDLTQDDIMIEPISEELDSYDDRLVPNHLSFKGTIPVVFTDPTPRTLASLVTKLALDGFRPGELINV